MAKTVYTSTVSVPIYASWRCPKCNSVNFSAGTISCQRETSSSGGRSKQNEARERSSSLVYSQWKQNAFQIMTNPRAYPQNIRKDLSIKNSKCKQCGRKPKWDKGMGYLAVGMLSLIPTLICGALALDSKKPNIVLWLLFGMFLGVFIFSILSEGRYKKMMSKLPDEYLPIIGSKNKELLTYCSEHGRPLPSPEECVAIVVSSKNNHGSII